MIRNCKYCGQPFEAIGTQAYCTREHFAICVVCGEKFKINNKYIGDVRKTCSRKCNNQLRKSTCMEKYGGPAPASSNEVQAKMKATTLERYGVEKPMQSKEIQDKVKKTNLEKYGTEWAIQSEEFQEQLKQSNLEKFGKEWAIQRDDVQEKIKQTTLERYGVECVFASPEIRDKIHQAYYEKTGYYEPFANPEVIAKSEETWMKNYGTKRPLQSEEVKRRSEETNLRKYGVTNCLKSSEIREKIKRTNLEKYGVENVFQSKTFRAKIARTHVERYGKPYFSQTREWKVSKMRDPEKVDNLLKFRENPIEFITSHFESKPTYRELVNVIGTSEGLPETLEKFNCQDMVAYVFYYMEQEVKEALLEIDPNLNMQINTKRIIKSYELDIYLPDYKIGIECNPTATHNSSFNMQHGKTDPDPTPQKYHQMKSDLCEQQGIFLFHIFGYDWEHKRDIIVSMLRNLLNKNENKIYGRNTIIKSITSQESSQFLNENHRQGNANASIRFGLFYNDELVSVMTFGKMRQSIGTSKHEDTTNTWELVRFCNRRNTSVIGGASKLFKHFIKTYLPQEIRSFSDRAHTRGNLYSTLGFTELRRSSAGYMWVDWNTDLAFHRINAQKQNIRKFLQDDSIDIENQTEVQIMESHGFAQVFDSGVITWVWKSN